MAAGLAVLALAAACGGSDDSGGSGGTGASSGNGTVSTKQFDNVGTVLVDSTGKALYFSDQETDGTIKCKKACNEIWFPATLADGAAAPAAPSGVTGKLGTLKRPDGKTQITLDGKPLYTFSFDKSGQAGGDNVPDEFDGTSFVWHVATASGAAAPSPTDSGSSGGYTY